MSRAGRRSKKGGKRGRHSNASRDQLYKIGLPGKSILGDYFQENMTSQRPFSQGASIYDVRTEGGGRVSPKEDVVREVA